MAFCPNCGTRVNGAFCENCGTSLGASGASGYAAPSATPTATSGGLSDNLAGALCYTPFFVGVILSIVFLFLEPYSKNSSVRFHALQSLFLHAALFLLSLVLNALLGLFAVATHGAGFLVGLGFAPLLWLAVLVLFLVLMYKTYNRQTVKLPFIGDLAQKQV